MFSDGFAAVMEQVAGQLSDNTINFEAHGDRYLGNTGVTEVDQGGLIVLGTEDISAVSGGGSNNRVRVTLWGCRMADNAFADLVTIGARWVTPSAAGLSANNVVEVEIRGDGGGGGRWQPIEFVENTVPSGPSYGNSASVIRY